jgi:hypothetical protein
MAPAPGVEQSGFPPRRSGAFPNGRAALHRKTRQRTLNLSIAYGGHSAGCCGGGKETRSHLPPLDHVIVRAFLKNFFVVAQWL